MAEALKVLFLTPEADPFAKTGGLADVAGSLPGALKRLGADVRMVLPFYRVVQEGGFRTDPVVENLKVSLGTDTLTADVMESRTVDDVPVYFIQREDMYNRPNLYGNPKGDYYDNLERFSFFSQASLRFMENLPFRPDVVHCHDWQTGLASALLKASSLYRDIPTVFTIHNVGYQGLFPAQKMVLTGLPAPDFFQPQGLEYYGNISFLKAGIVYSEAITTVSPSYAREIQTAEYGRGMEGILSYRRDSIHGILNGVDYRIWDPATDPLLPANYSPRNLDGKIACKKSLIQDMGLDLSLENGPLLGVVSRLDKQKGLDLLIEILDDILDLQLGLVVLGTGEKPIQDTLKNAARKHTGRLAAKIGFDNELAHRIYAGSDMFLIPSRYEPCGLTQMYSLKYGAAPLVRATGGLDDTIADFNPDTSEGNGFKFQAADPREFFDAIRKAVTLYKNPDAWKKLILNGMKADFSWDRSARTYLDLYTSLAKK